MCGAHANPRQCSVAGRPARPTGARASLYVAAGSPHVDCGDTERTEAFYRVAAPFFGVVLLAWSLAAVLPAVILEVSLAADPICFTF